MFETLAGYLEAAVVPEQRAVCLDACWALVAAGIDDHDFLIDQRLSQAESLDNDAILTIVNITLKPIYVNVLAQFGVRLSEEATLVQMTDVVKCLHLVDNYGDPESLRDRCDSPDGAEASLADVFELLGAFDSTEYLTFIDYVAPSLMDRLAEQCKQESEEPMPDTAIVDRSRERVRKLLAIASIENAEALLLFKALADGARLGIDIDLLIAPFHDELETFPPQRLGVELLAFGLASGTSDELLRTTVAAQMDKLPLDMPKITAADAVITKFLQQVLHA